MRTAKDIRIQVMIDYLKVKIGTRLETRVQLDEQIDMACGQDETFNFAWMKVKPFQREYIKNKVWHQIEKLPVMVTLQPVKNNA